MDEWRSESSANASVGSVVVVVASASADSFVDAQLVRRFVFSWIACATEIAKRAQIVTY